MFRTLGILALNITFPQFLYDFFCSMLVFLGIQQYISTTSYSNFQYFYPHCALSMLVRFLIFSVNIGATRPTLLHIGSLIVVTYVCLSLLSQMENTLSCHGPQDSPSERVVLSTLAAVVSGRAGVTVGTV